MNQQQLEQLRYIISESAERSEKAHMTSLNDVMMWTFPFLAISACAAILGVVWVVQHYRWMRMSK